MCGIAGATGEGFDVEAALDAIAHRGPDARGTARLDDARHGHVRLAILDLDHRSDQPFAVRGGLLSFVGEIWNYRELREELEADGETFRTEGDTEVLAVALATWGVDSALRRANGMFAFAYSNERGTWLARDRFGEVPLHYSPIADGIAWSSELKGLRAGGAMALVDVQPGERVELRTGARSRWYFPHVRPVEPVGLDEASLRLGELVATGVRERAISDVPVCTLLSGGVDSSIVAAHLARVIPDLVALTAVLDPKARDLREARAAAEMIGIPLIEVQVEVPTADDLSRVVGVIEMPYKAQVEIGWACLALADAMRAEGFKVTFSGEGSDELWASYGFAYHAFAQGADWHAYRRDLFLSQHRKNFARCNKVFMSRGVECRLPFLHPSLVEYALRLPREAVQDGRSKPKAVLQRAAAGLVPGSVVARGKVAFQDGMGLKRAIGEAVPDPAGLYRREYARQYA